MCPLSRLKMYTNPFQGRHQYSFQSADEADKVEDIVQDGFLAFTPAQIASHKRRHLNDITVVRWIEDVARADGEVPSALAAYASVASAKFYRKIGDSCMITILMWVGEQDSSDLRKHEPLDAMYFLVRQMQADGSVISQDFGISTLTELLNPQVEELYDSALSLAQAHHTMRG